MLENCGTKRIGAKVNENIFVLEPQNTKNGQKLKKENHTGPLEKSVPWKMKLKRHIAYGERMKIVVDKLH